MAPIRCRGAEEDELLDSVYVLVAVGAIVAGFVQGLSGFAFGMVAMSFWVWVLDPRLAAALAVFGSLTGQIVAAASLRRKLNAPLLLPFLLGGLCGVPLGVWLLPRMDIDLFKAVLGGLLVLWCPAMLMAKNLPRIERGGRVADGLVGVVGGAMGGLGGCPFAPGATGNVATVSYTHLTLPTIYSV